MKTTVKILALVGVCTFTLSSQPTCAKKKVSVPDSTMQDTTIYKDSRQIPLFKGKPWDPAFRLWVANRLQYPEALAQRGLGGRVIVRFVLEKDGSINQVEILESPYLLLSAEVIRVLGLSPKWTPAKNEKGEFVRLQIVVPINFVMAPDPRKDKSLPPQIRQGNHGF